FFVLRLGDAKTFSATPVRAEDANPLTFPRNAVVKYSFPARGDMPPVDIYWYEDGQFPPRPEGIPAEQQIGDGKNGSLFIGENGFATAGEYGGEARLLPDERMKEYTRPEPTLERVPGANHYRNFLEACKGGPPAVSDFSYAAPLTEFVLLGTVALRVGRTVTYDTEKMEITGDAEATQLLRGTYRKGWELPV
ncbi:MAG TPA: gfo/Idh/MocA family oxidoreductase, partial [Candidatus Hydrogenedentes bacterium]|nr:gfo/Idh/MocA family oxidoreductase [Candidatus Hydrogenedentota bacterium]